MGQSQRERIYEARKRAQRTGQRTSLIVNKHALAEEFPEFKQDPRFGLTPESFLMHNDHYEGVVIRELLELCVKAKGHPLAIIMVAAVQGKDENRAVYIRRSDLDTLKAVADNKPLVVGPSLETEDENVHGQGEQDLDPGPDSA